MTPFKNFPISRIKKFNALPSDHLVRVYTYQHDTSLIHLEQNGFFSGYADHTLSQASEWTRAYGYMKEAMMERIPNFSGDAPVWAWIKRPSVRKKYRRAYKGLKEENRVIALVPKSRILLSDFDMWHCCLNDNSVDWTEDEFEKNGELYPQHWTYMQEDMREEYFKHIKSTWHRVFEFPEDRDKSWCGAKFTVQACIDRIYKDEIVSIRKIMPRHG